MPVDDFHRSVETLLIYLADRRPKYPPALATFHITHDQAGDHPPLSAASIDELFGMPNAPLSELAPEQLLRQAQIVDTAFFKSYITLRPILVGSLCRIPNWCEVVEVEQELRSRKVSLLHASNALQLKVIICLEIFGAYRSLQWEAYA